MFSYLSVINLWNPTHISGWVSIILLALLLGIIHGITPDEHTWPITFSYAIGSYSTKKGLRAGIVFSLAFTLQRAIASELAYLGLSRLYTSVIVNNIVYVIVGLVMAISGLIIMRFRTIFHLDLPFVKAHHIDEKTKQPKKEWLEDPRPWMPAVHGFIAGWGFGAFAIIIYTVLAPAAHSAIWGWVPGAIFGVGTMLMQALIGATFGRIASRKGLSEKAIRSVALKTAGNTLIFGGIAFVIAGIAGQLFPKIASFNLSTGLHIHNLDNLGLAFILVVICVAGIGLTTLIRQTNKELNKLHPKH